jgi:hypothetical protein
LAITRLIAVLAALVVCAGPVAAAAADAPVELTVDGRPVGSATVALQHNGVVFAEIGSLTRTFQGSLHAQGTSTSVHLPGGYAGTFTAGSAVMHYGGGAYTMKGAAFLHDGKLYVPLNAFVVKLARQRLFVDLSQTHANILVSANPNDF